ncbi:arylesterase [Guyparkeria hydrothermalis]|uniref:arylesterase n=1 Tax=Guyparkeria hydrothermalis TaxID=923 RepID=UPI00202063C9|nr:arylesterase [Guyparkeria hydrothermalis]MCL7744142.1 arylesterase [Guyparkeria hydrothermalis]
MKRERFVTRWWVGWLAVLLLGLAGCGDKPLEPLAQDDTILAFGDSLTEGVGAAPQAAYPEQLAALTGHPVVNAGVAGETTAEGLDRLPNVLDRHDPALMILLMGGNDVLRNQDLGEAKRNLGRMIEIARSRDIAVVLVGVPEKSLFSRSAPLYEELAAFYEVVLVEDLVASLLRRPGYKSDAVHLNADGYRAMAERLAEALRDAGAL